MIGSLDIARGKKIVIPVSSKGITAEVKVETVLEMFFSKKSRVDFNMLVQSMGTNAVYQNVISSNGEIGGLRGAWNGI